MNETRASPRYWRRFLPALVLVTVLLITVFLLAPDNPSPIFRPYKLF